jgi:two-component system, OmpR family, response regulator
MADFRVVLVVDGDAASREFASRALREDGFLVAQAGTVEIALELMRHVVADILFIDVLLLAAAGDADLVGGARRVNPGLRVVCITGLDRAAADEGTLGLCELLLQKPYRAEQLQTEIRRLLPT